jgi:hypothetical protein
MVELLIISPLLVGAVVVEQEHLQHFLEVVEEQVDI